MCVHVCVFICGCLICTEKDKCVCMPHMRAPYMYALYVCLICTQSETRGIRDELEIYDVLVLFISEYFRTLENIVCFRIFVAEYFRIEIYHLLVLWRIFWKVSALAHSTMQSHFRGLFQNRDLSSPGPVADILKSQCPNTFNHAKSLYGPGWTLSPAPL